MWEVGLPGIVSRRAGDSSPGGRGPGGAAVGLKPAAGEGEGRLRGLDQRSAYISSGTWSLVGVELNQPVLSPRAWQLNFTNEGGVAGTIRFLKNVGGLWLLQECQRQWQRMGQQYNWPELVALAEGATPLRSLVDPDAPDFLSPGDMPAAIRAYCQRTSQPEPNSVGMMVAAAWKAWH